MRMRCKKCGHEWEYKGSAYYATCPRCHTKNRVPANGEREEEYDESDRKILLIEKPSIVKRWFG